MSVHESGYWRMIKAAVEAAKLRRSSTLLCLSLLTVLQGFTLRLQHAG